MRLRYRIRPLDAISWMAIGLETVLWIVRFKKRGEMDRTVHEGISGRMLKTAEVLTGPLSLVLRAFGLVPFAAAAFVIGSFISRFGWVRAGRESAKDPAAVFASQS